VALFRSVASYGVMADGSIAPTCDWSKLATIDWKQTLVF
jgi:hypothetical protein